MSYVIKRTSDGAYVAPAGSPSSFTRALQHARTWTSREAAERERCPENEVVVAAEEEIRR